MKLFYLKYTLFQSSYRCDMVRKRLIKFIRQNKPDAVIISGINADQAKAFLEFTNCIDNLSLNLIVENGKHTINNHQIVLSDKRMLLDKRLITPIEGCVSMIDLEPYALHYIVLDIFADENFADYHGEIDDGQLQELNDLLRNE
jgi:hypothetical protein